MSLSLAFFWIRNGYLQLRLRFPHVWITLLSLLTGVGGLVNVCQLYKPHLAVLFQHVITYFHELS